VSDSSPDAGLPGRFHVERVVGQGGFGVVLRAHDQELDRPVAIKRLLTTGASQDAAARFRREAKRTAALRHPHVIEVLDFGADEAGAPYLVYEWIDGRDLEALLAAREHPTPAQLRGWGAAIAEALHLAHQAGVVHRDVKPANVLLREDGHVLLADLGIARVSRGETLRTAEGVILGTPAYMAPELLQGEPASPASDQWAWAASLMELAGGAPAWGTEVPAELFAAAREEREFPAPAALRAEDPGLARVLERATAWAPEQRFPDLAALAAALGEPPGPAAPRAATTVVLEPPPPTVDPRLEARRAFDEARRRLIAGHRGEDGAWIQTNAHRDQLGRALLAGTVPLDAWRDFLETGRAWLETLPLPWQGLELSGEHAGLQDQVNDLFVSPAAHLLQDLTQVRREFFRMTGRAVLDDLTFDEAPIVERRGSELVAAFEDFLRSLGPLGETPGTTRVILEARTVCFYEAADTRFTGAPPDAIAEARRTEALRALARAMARERDPEALLELGFTAHQFMMLMRTAEDLPPAPWNDLIHSILGAVHAPASGDRHMPQRVSLAIWIPQLVVRGTAVLEDSVADAHTEVAARQAVEFLEAHLEAELRAHPGARSAMALDPLVLWLDGSQGNERYTYTPELQAIAERVRRLHERTREVR
jgi:hypothetical protein